MARVPGVPDQQVAQDGGPQRINAPEGAFGANVVAGVFGAGAKAAEGISDTFAKRAINLAQIDNRIAVDAAGQALADQQYTMGLEFRKHQQGERAEPALTGAYTALDRIREEAGAHLISPAARELYNSQSRVGTLQMKQGLASFAAQEGHKARNDKIDGQLKIALRGLSADNFLSEAPRITGELASLKADLNGMSPEAAKAWAAEGLGDAAYGIVAGLAPKDPNKAAAFLIAHNDLLNSNQRTAAASLIESSKTNFLVRDVAGAALARAQGAGASYTNAVDAREGKAQNPYSSAVGRGQFVNSTWLSVMKGDPQFAEAIRGKTDAEILALRADDALAGKAIMSYRGMNAGTLQTLGVSPTSANLGMAHGYGPEGARAILAADPSTPMQNIIGAQTARNNRVYGKTAGDVVAEFNTRFADTDKYDALVANSEVEYAAIGSDPTLKGDPVLVDKVRTEFLSQRSALISMHNSTAQSAYDRLLSAAVGANTTDMAVVQNSYPEALSDINTLSTKEQLTLQRAITTRGNSFTSPMQLEMYRYLIGLQRTDPQAFIDTPLTTIDLPQAQKTELLKAKAALQAHNNMDKFKEANTARALGDTLVKSAIKDAKLTRDQRVVFAGGMIAALENWAKHNPGKEPPLQEVRNMAYGLLSERETTLTTRSFGVKLWESKGKALRYEVPEYYLDQIPPNATETRRVLLTKKYGHAPSPDQVAENYIKETY